MASVKMVASDGMMLTNGSVFGRVIFLGTGDSPDNWQEITIAEAENRMKQEGEGYEEDLY